MLLDNISSKEYIQKTEERNLDYWDRIFLEAKEVYLETQGNNSKEDCERRQKVILRLTDIMLTKDKKIGDLISQYFDLKDMLEIKARLVGSGMIGGKALGMILARKIIEHEINEEILESHDSFYIGSDVFYSYIVQNGWWSLRMKQRTKDGYFKTAKVLKEKMLSGEFPAFIKEKLLQILEYYGQAPIIVRSSSLLEDSFGNAFAGKYESYFCVNQKEPKERYEEFEDAIKKVYASCLSQDALSYRLQRNLEKNDEQMCILVQRVSGSYHNSSFFPDLAGVGVSYNTYVWSKDIDPEAGMIRLVYGLGTRAVDRTGEDYPRIVSLDKPLLKTHKSIDELRKFSQHSIDLLDLKKNTFSAKRIEDLDYEGKEKILKYIGEYDHETKSRMRELNIQGNDPYILTFDRLFKSTDTSTRMKKILKTIEKAYDYPVDIEFTMNFADDNKVKINLLQCRPLQTKGISYQGELKDNINNKDIIIKTQENFMGGSVDFVIDYVVFVDVGKYVSLKQSEKYSIAKIIGNANNILAKDNNVIIIGPGRWGTTTPALGVPISFSDINNMKAIVEYSSSEYNYFPELSFGSHFFQDLVETDIFYIAVFDENENVIFNTSLLKEMDKEEKTEIIKNYNTNDTVVIYKADKSKLLLQSDLLKQKVVLYKKE